MDRLRGRANQKLTAAVLVEYGDTCHLCLRPGATTRDHLVPFSLGGDDSIENQRPAHMRCNSKRGNRAITAELLAQFRSVGAITTDAAWFFENRPAGHPAPPVLSPSEGREKRK